MESLQIPEWVIKLGFHHIDGLTLDEEKSFHEQEENEEVTQLVFLGDKEIIKKSASFFASKLKIENKYFYIGGNLESEFFPRGIFQKGLINITLNGVGKYFVVTLIKNA